MKKIEIKIKENEGELIIQSSWSRVLKMLVPASIVSLLLSYFLHWYFPHGDTFFLICLFVSPAFLTLYSRRNGRSFSRRNLKQQTPILFLYGMWFVVVFIFCVILIKNPDFARLSFRFISLFLLPILVHFFTTTRTKVTLLDGNIVEIELAEGWPNKYLLFEQEDFIDVDSEPIVASSHCKIHELKITGPFLNREEKRFVRMRLKAFTQIQTPVLEVEDTFRAQEPKERRGRLQSISDLKQLE